MFELVAKMLGQNVFGSLWTTVPGTWGLIVVVRPLIDEIYSGKTFGQIVTSPAFVGFMTSVIAVISPDPHKGKRF